MTIIWTQSVYLSCRRPYAFANHCNRTRPLFVSIWTWNSYRNRPETQCDQLVCLVTVDARNRVCVTVTTIALWMTYVSMVSLIRWIEVVSGRPRPQLPLFGHRRFEQIRMRRIRNSGRVWRVTAVPRTEVRVWHGYDDGTVLLTHGRHCVWVVGIRQMFLKVSSTCSEFLFG